SAVREPHCPHSGKSGFFVLASPFITTNSPPPHLRGHMFRKRIASSGMLAFSTLAAGLILPSVLHLNAASAQVMDMDDDEDGKVIDMDEGEGVIDLDSAGPTGPAAVAGEPTSTMTQAKAAFDG